MITRPFWLERIEKAWADAPIVWLAGVRRVGKTTLARSLGHDHIQYVNCDLPVVAEMLADPEFFFRNAERPVIVFDEIHQLPDPSRVLKIGADVFPHLRILATGSSTLAASNKFRDTLTGRRKRQVHLTPVLCDELDAFDRSPLLKRLYHGGLPDALLSEKKSPAFYREWMDSFYARDIHQLFAFRNPDKFNALFEYMMRQSSELLETSRVARAVGISRATVESHLRALEVTHAITVVRPFHGGGQGELVKMPKAYAFDTGFVSFSRGWDPLRPADYGALWEHAVLEYLLAHSHEWPVQYWRDTAGHKIDFVIARNRDEVDVIECKWDPAQFDSKGLAVFRSRYPNGRNYVVSPISVEGYVKAYAGLKVHVCNLEGWLKRTIRAK